MGDPRLGLQVLLILLLVLAGTPGEALAASLEWTAASDPTRAVFQAIETRGETTRSATLYDDGRVEVWQETPRSPAFWELPEIGRASRWATLLLATKQLLRDDDRAALPPLESATFERMADFEEVIVELRVKEVSKTQLVTEQLRRTALVELVQSLARAGVAGVARG